MAGNNLVPVNYPSMRLGHSAESLLVEDIPVLVNEAEESNRDEEEEECIFSEASHPSVVLGGLNELRSSGQFCDVTICVDGEEFPSHKIVLASFSPYFKAMFSGELSESRQDKVSINGMEPTMIKLLINYAYTAKVVISKSNVQSLLAAANLLEVLPVRDACCAFLEKHMDESNCLGIHCFAETHACVDLQKKSKDYILKFFPEIWQHEEFLKLTPGKLIEFISDDNLYIENEEDVFSAVLRWHDHDPDNHSVNFYKVCEHVRLPLVNPYFLHDVVAKHVAVVNSPACRQLVDEAKTYHLLQDRRAELRTPRTRPRKASGEAENMDLGFIARIWKQGVQTEVHRFLGVQSVKHST